MKLPLIFRAGLLLLSLSAPLQAPAQTATTTPAITGTWQGNATSKGQSIPVAVSITGKAPNLKATLINGAGGTPASSASYTDGHLLLNFNYYARSLDVTLQDGALTGTFGGKRTGFMPITLHRAALAAAPKLDKPSILGDWEIAVHSTRGESAWQLHLTPSDAKQDNVRAVIQRIDGDTGFLYGSSAGGPFIVSRATAAGVVLIKIAPQPDNTLLVTDLLDDKPEAFVARRPAEARKQNLAPPTDTAQQTTPKDPDAPFQWSFPDLAGKVVSNSDPQFDGKVVLIAVGGSWCINCHDEAPLLVSLYKQFHASGLEIVNFSFEEENQLKDPARLRVFIDRYKIPYTVLLAGTTDQLEEKLPQFNNLNCWPTSFFVGRDGKIKEIHAGFAGPANPAAHDALVKEMTELLEHLLAEPAPIRTASLTQ